MLDQAIAAVTGVLGGGAVSGVLTAYFTSKRSMHQDLFEQLSGRLESVERSDKECQQRNLELAMEVGRLREAVSRLESRVVE